MGALCESLKTNTTLETLNLQGSLFDKLGAAEAKIIADMLKVNSALTTLDLQYNNIGDEGGEVIRGAWQGKAVDLKL